MLIVLVACASGEERDYSEGRDAQDAVTGDMRDTGVDPGNDTVLPDTLPVYDTMSDTIPDAMDTSTPDNADVPVRGVQPLSLGYKGRINALCRDQYGHTYAVGTHGYCALVRNRDFLPLGFPGKADLTGCACDGESLFVSGTNGTVYRYDKDGWKNLRPPTSRTFTAIGAARGTVFAVGGQGMVMQWNGTGWRVEYTGVKYALNAIWLSKASGPFVVGSDGMMLYKQGNAWITRQIAFPTSNLYGIYRDPSGLMVVVGTKGLVVTSNNNDAWQVQVTNEDVDPPRDLHAVYGLGPKTIYVAGSKGAVFKFNGHRWGMAKLEGPYNTNQDLYALTAWTAQDGTPRVLAMGAQGKGMFFNGKAFVDAFAGIRSGLHGLSCNGSRVTAVGQQGTVLTVQSDVVASSLADTAVDLYAVSTRYAVGAKGTILDMATLKPRKDCVVNTDLYGVIDTKNKSVAVGQGGSVVDILSDKCDVYTPLSGVNLNGLAVLKDGKLVIVGDGGTVLLREGKTFTQVQGNLIANLRGVVPYGNGALIVGDNGTVLKLANGKLVTVSQKPASFFYGVAASGTTAMIAGWAGEVWQYDGAALTRIQSNTPVTLNAVCQYQGMFYFAGDEGFLGEYQP